MEIHSDREGRIEVDESELISRLDASIQELRSQLEQAEKFKRKIEDNTIEPLDYFLDFTSAIENGYDRTGPDVVSLVSRSERRRLQYEQSTKSG